MHTVLRAGHFLQIAFEETNSGWRRRASRTNPVLVIRAFMEHLQFGQSYSGPLINSYLSAVRFNLLHFGVSIDFFANPIIPAARAATERVWRITHPESDSKTLPASVDFCIHLAKCTHEARDLHSIIESAFTCLLRISECMVTPAKHYILAGSTTFERCQLIDPSGETVISFISPALVHSVPKHKVDYNVRSAESDQPGVGHPYEKSPLIRYRCV